MHKIHVGLLALVLWLKPASSSAGEIAYYSFDSDYTDGIGTNDLISGGGSPAITPTGSKFGSGALDLTGGAHLATTSTISFASNQAWSISFWAKRRVGATDASGMVIGDDSDNSGFIWNTATSGQVSGGNGSGGIRFRPENGNSTSPNNDYAVGTDTSYNHVVLIADGAGKIELYYNGASQGGSLAASSGLTTFNINAIGNAYGGTSLAFDGQLDEIHIFDEAIDAAKVAELYTGGDDTTDPTLVSISDDRGGGPVEPDSLVTYTVTFSEDMDAATVTTADFSNVGTANTTIGTVIESAPGVFQVPVTATSTGSLQLQINQSAVLSDPSGNNLDTTTAIPDDTTITVEVDDVPPTLQGNDIVDDKDGGPVAEGTTVTYTITFSEDIDESTLDATDFGNAGDATFSIGTITEISPGVFTIEVIPSSGGTLQLEIISGAIIDDFAGNPLDTIAAIPASGTITVFEAPTPADVTRLRVVLLGGQSNMEGRAPTTGLPTSPVNLLLPQNDVDFYYKGGGGTLTTLRPGLSDSGQFGPEVTIGRHLADEIADGITTRLALVKYARGGTNLHTQWAAGGDDSTTGDGTEYKAFQNTVNNGLVALSSSYPNATIELVGMVWLQGESDAGSASNAAAYETNLGNFIADVRATYGADLRFVVIRLSNNQTSLNAANLATIRAAQTAVASADPLTALANSDGFGMKGDNLHFDTLGQQQNGHASALQLLNLYPFLDQPRPLMQSDGILKITVGRPFDGFDYTLKRSTILPAVNWETVDSVSAGSTVEFTLPISGPRNFFRVVRELQTP